MHVKSSKWKQLHRREVCYFLTQNTPNINGSLLAMCINKCVFDLVLCIWDCREKKKIRQGFQCFIYFAGLWLQRWKSTQHQNTKSPCICHPGSLAGVTTGSSRMSWQWPPQEWLNHNPEEDRQTNVHPISGLLLPQGQGLCQIIYVSDKDSVSRLWDKAITDFLGELSLWSPINQR